jgi:putative transposase
MIAKHPVHIDAMVVLPDHIHAIWTLADDDDNYSVRWQLFKALFSKNIPETDQPQRSDSRIKKRELAVWQRRFWEHRIRDAEDFKRHIDYIHYNPVKHGHVTRVRDWEYSTFHRYVKRGIYATSWGGDDGVDSDTEGWAEAHPTCF